MTELKHYGILRKSGRYPWGSGEFPYQSDPSFRSQVHEFKKQGKTEKETAEAMGLSIAKLRAEISLEKAAERKSMSDFATRLKDKGYSNVAIGKRMGINESSVRNLLDPAMQERALITEKTADMLKKQVEEKLYLDVGAGVENSIGVSRSRLNVAIAELEKSGYKLQYVATPQLTRDKQTTLKVLTKDTVDPKELYANRDKIRTIDDWTDDGGRSWNGRVAPAIVDISRIAIKFKEDGGGDMDGVIQLRRGVEDLSLGDKRYGQVRIAVNGTHFMKGMAIYSDNLPKGVDIIFNTSKSKNTPILGDKDNSIFKPVKADPTNPFGAEFIQRNYIGKDGKTHLSAINMVGTEKRTNEEGSWNTWSKALSSQFLSKQTPALAKQQLDISLKLKEEEFAEYLSYTNPTVKQKLLLTFANNCDSDAVHLKAAALPRQGNYIILPLTTIKPTEIYAPKFNNGETVVLVRHPHGGIFEIPQLKVNNNNPEAKSIFDNALDAVGIHPSVAKKLSGADFDGDTVLVIPNPKGSIRISDSLKALTNFDPKISYSGYEGMKPMSSRNAQLEMGKISNLITDMTIKGASQDEIARAVRHSMVVIDAEKHFLNYKQSYIDNGIAKLKETYQGGATRGASTLISRAKSDIRITKRNDEYKIDKLTGQKIFTQTPEFYINDKGQRVERKTKSTRMYETPNAYLLSSGTRMENIYAEYANSLKALGDRARKEAVDLPRLVYSPSAKKTYSFEVESLKSKLYSAVSNKPRERQALLLASKMVRDQKQANPDLKPADMKKIKGQALAESRFRTHAKKESILITPKEWEAIQAGAISDGFLREILSNTPLDLIKQYATPRTDGGVSTTKLTKARFMLEKGYTQAEVAYALGLSVTTLMNAINEAQN